MITKLVLRNEIYTLRLNKKSFFSSVLGFSPYWDSKNYGNENYSEKNRDLSIINKLHLKCDVTDGSVLGGIRQAIFYSFVLDKPPVYRVYTTRN